MCETVGVFDFWQGNSCNSQMDFMRELLWLGKEIKVFLNTCVDIKVT